MCPNPSANTDLARKAAQASDFKGEVAQMKPMLIPPAHEALPSHKTPLQRQLLYGAIIGAATAAFLVLLIAGIDWWMEGKNEANNSLFAVLTWCVLIPLGIITLAPLWIEQFHLFYISLPWHLILRHVLPEMTAIVVGFILNGATLGSLLAFLSRKRY